MRELLGEFHQAGVASLAGFAVPSLRTNDLTLSAAAEYAWNSTGRTPQEFVLSWATRQRLLDPEKVVQWWELIENPQRDFYNSQLTAAWSPDRMARSIAERQPVHFLKGFA